MAMRGTAAGFRIDAPSFLNDPRTASFTAADVGALVLLTCHAWAGGGEIPSDPETLAAWSRLGDAWPGSKVAKALHLFFRIGVNRLVSIDLEPQMARDSRERENKAAAGRASGRARRTAVQHLFNRCSTPVRQVFDATGDASVATRAGVQPAAAAPNAPGRVECSVSGPPEAGGSAGIDDGGDGAPGDLSFPPHTPLIRDVLSSLSGDGGVGEGETKKACPVDLFGSPLEPRGRPKARKPTQEDRDAASLIVDAYIDEVRPEEARTARADANVSKWIAEGASLEDLRSSVRHYARLCDRTNRDPQYRKAPHNFFGRESAFWRAYTKEPTSEHRYTGPTGRIRTGKSYEGIGVTVSTAEPDPAAVADAPGEQAPEHRANPFRAP